MSSPLQQQLRIGVCGLGAMGRGMVKNLLTAGFEVHGYDIVPSLVERFTQDGGKAATSPKEVASRVDILLIIVVNSTQVSSVLFDAETGAVLGLPRNKAIIVSSTVPGAYIREVRQRLDVDHDRPDIHLLDCPVSGGASGAADGTLTVFACGSDEGMILVEPVLYAIGKDIHRIRNSSGANGETGSGANGKVCHQVLPEIEIALVAEVMALAARAGLNTQEVYDHLQAGVAASWIMGNRIPHALENDDTVRSAMTNSQKDSAIIVRTAGELSYPVPLVAAAEQIYQTTVHIGWPGMDDSALWRLYLRDFPDDTVYQLTKSASIRPDSVMSLQDLEDIMIGVHLAAAAESQGFTRAIGLDAEQMYGIICGAAGWNVQFENYARRMKKGPWYLQEIDGARHIGIRLVSRLIADNSPWS
ncbi:uncharacterized protein MYCFIDRAFT_47062 [Pseudocercospora fijiensis CIRAD86]|uniref:6-phosphogluconate dehydrogenase NADP-binding domain-containing protein n=1 Tax=Pseudocercospora fijiensis (strain CIRAD86) TaxID=383855 RepID=M2ZXA3_PSEFD|nr:uncharacterized protein MYCFIDRAFT_47062 [Pseudocercospora fijiensis CIRAD86]EME83619.1 hypothetical protein MYCFIDRAFT_47062 [Pseudocercospora fijiensis CIRAD86]